MNRGSEISKNNNNNMEQKLNVFVNLGNLDLVSNDTIRYYRILLERIRDAPNVRGINVIIPFNSNNPFSGHFPAEFQTGDEIISLYLLNLHSWGSCVTLPAVSCVNCAKMFNAPVLTSPDDLHWFVQNSGILNPDWDGIWPMDQLKWLNHKASQFVAHLDHMLSLELLRPYVEIEG